MRNGKLAIQGVYAFEIDAVSLNSEDHHFTGKVVLLRHNERQ